MSKCRDWIWPGDWQSFGKRWHPPEELVVTPYSRGVKQYPPDTHHSLQPSHPRSLFHGGGCRDTAFDGGRCWWRGVGGKEPAPAAGGCRLTSTHLPRKWGSRSILKGSLAWKWNVKDKIKETSSPTETRGERQLSRLLNINRNEPSLPLLRWLLSLRWRQAGYLLPPHLSLCLSTQL